LKKHNNSGKKSEPTSKRAKPQGTMRRDTKEVLAELAGKLKEKLDPKKVAATSAGERDQRGELRPNLDRLTVGADLATDGAITAFWVWREKRWRKDSCGRRRRTLPNSFRH
jgi:hypothetical protein